ncbi:hypothetical protein TREMEDRAFT_63828 [Tremella mesenterica DSM 1558]|uniref:uncharacterized protein n=1 Tax=Tremella mesenterica (strain ATCC 24925 / CBS 8224 / DSM 1558 / NBRC 9311 / NRRL Y-6157 / RJB 2259-6 / UBC 559-6) TaxID=578456 RepID=UPI0003F494A8|nr:uncharacterized protein TREMEDRAFT_63828 [Tremella mesenterica DSM 1558]EIW67942.1 hypothetical protein TREMEDRAFT_63828 [Tremella mesenterica DSM 1558]
MSDQIDELENDIKPEINITPKRTKDTGNVGPTRKTPKSKTTPKKETQEMEGVWGGGSTKGRFAMMIIETGIKTINKDAAAAELGLNGKQLREWVRRDGKGAVYKSLKDFCDSL